MGRAFTEEERIAIRKQIKQVAKNMFEEQGLKNFRMQQLTKEVGISLGGFYTFFENKEALYKEIIEDEEERIRQKILGIIKVEKQSPKSLLMEVAIVIKDKMQNNKLYNETEGQLANMLSSLVLGEDESSNRANLRFLEQAKVIWQELGYEVKASSKEILGSLTMIGSICRTQKTMEPQIFDKLFQKVVESLIELI